MGSSSGGVGNESWVVVSVGAIVTIDAIVSIGTMVSKGTIGGVGEEGGVSSDSAKNIGNNRLTPDRSAFSSMTSPEPISSDDKAYPTTKAMGMRRRRIILA
jgi:hypothetical protein